MAEDDTRTAVAPVSETGGLDTTRVEPPSVEPPPEPPEPKQSITQQLAEQQLELGRKRIEQIDRQIGAEEESRTRQRTAEDKERAIKERGATEEIADLRSRIKMREERPQPQPLPPMPRPNNLFGGPDSGAPGNAYMMALQVLGGIGSGRTRGDAIIAMKAIQGILKGSDAQYQNSLKIWKEQTAAIEKQNRHEADRYDQILADNKSTMDDKRRMIELEAMPSHDTAVAEAARRGDFEHISELIDKRYKLVGDMVEHLRKGQDKLDEAAVRQDAIGLLDSGRTPAGRGTAYNAAVVAEARRIGIYERGMSETQVDQRIAQARNTYIGQQAGARATGAGIPRVEIETLKQTELILSKVRQFSNYTKSNLRNLITLAERIHPRLGIPVADALIIEGKAALRDSPDAAAFLAQLTPVRDEIARILTTNTSNGGLTVTAIKQGESLVKAGYSASTLRQIADLFETDFANRELELTIEANVHRKAIGAPEHALPNVPPLPPAGGRSKNTPAGVIKRGKGGKDYRKLNDGVDTDKDNWELVQ